MSLSTLGPIEAPPPFDGPRCAQSDPRASIDGGDHRRRSHRGRLRRNARASMGATGMQTRAEAKLARSEAAFLRELQSKGTDLTALVRVIVDDARVRTTLATPGIDDETIQDLLRDMRTSTESRSSEFWRAGACEPASEPMDSSARISADRALCATLGTQVDRAACGL